MGSGIFFNKWLVNNLKRVLNLMSKLVTCFDLVADSFLLVALTKHSVLNLNLCSAKQYITLGLVFLVLTGTFVGGKVFLGFDSEIREPS